MKTKRKKERTEQKEVILSKQLASPRGTQAPYFFFLLHKVGVALFAR